MKKVTLIFSNATPIQPVENIFRQVGVSDISTSAANSAVVLSANVGELQIKKLETAVNTYNQSSNEKLQVNIA